MQFLVSHGPPAGQELRVFVQDITAAAGMTF